MSADLLNLVEAALSEDGDFDAAWERVSAAVNASPRDVALRHLRLRMAEAAYLRVEQVTDLRALCDLEPDARDLALRLALMEHRWAWQLAERTLSADSVAALQLEDDAIGRQSQHIQTDAMNRLTRLAAAHARDADFVVSLLTHWDDGIGPQYVWQRLQVCLQALAANPTDGRLERDLALQWAGISECAPSVQLPEGTHPMGFAIDVYGNLHEALMTERALQAIGALPADVRADAQMQNTLGRLQLGVSRFERAAEAFQCAAQAWDRQLAAGSADDADIQARADEARELAQHCAAGRSQLAQAWMQDMRKAAASLGEGYIERPEASATAQAFLAQARASSLQAQSELQAVLDTQGAQVEREAQPPDASALAAMDALAARLGASVLGALSFTPVAWRTMDDTTPDRARDHRLLAAESLFGSLDLVSAGWLEHLDFSRQLGAPAAFRIWHHRSGDCLLSHAAAGHLEVVDVETEFSDGHQLITSQTRGRGFLGGGPRLDALSVDVDLPLGAVLALHRARVALHLSRFPGLRVSALAGPQDFIALQERQRQFKTAWRLQEGLSEFEALGVPTDKPEYFVPRLRQQVKLRVAEAYAAFRRAGQARP